MHEEIWKDIKGFEGLYQTSNLGRVKSLAKMKMQFGKYPKSQKERILKNCLVRDYPMVNLTKDKKMYPVQYIHDLVLKAFVGEKPKGMECARWDGDKTNNKLENLRYATRRENLIDDKIRLHGKCAWAKLFSKDVFDIKKRLCKGEPEKNIAKFYNITPSTINRIKNNFSHNNIAWPDVPKNFYEKPSAMKLGIKAYNGKLTEADIIEIKRLLKNGEKGYYIAKLFNVHEGIISKIKTKRIWFNVN